MRSFPKKIFALDFGTTKFCLGMLQSIPKSKPRLDIVSRDSAGMHKGMMVDITKAQQALEQLIESAEKKFNADINSVVLGVAGQHLSGIRVKQTIDLDAEIIETATIRQLRKQIESKNIKDSSEILHTIPISFQIDSRPETDNPLGQSGSKLTGEYFIVYSDKSYLKDLIRLCNNAGLHVESIYAESVASASVTLEDELKYRGAVIIDVGGGTTDCLLFQNGKPYEIFTINIAGVMMSNDLSIGLNLSTEEAERIKVYFGLRNEDPSKTIKARSLTGSTFNISRYDVQRILNPRVRELGYYIAKHLQKYKGLLKGGLILTGGASETDNLAEFLKTQLKIPVSKVYPTMDFELSSPSEQMNWMYSLKHATVLGLINLELLRYREERITESNFLPARYLSSFINWIKEMT